MQTAAIMGELCAGWSCVCDKLALFSCWSRLISNLWFMLSVDSYLGKFSIVSYVGRLLCKLLLSWVSCVKDGAVFVTS